MKAEALVTALWMAGMSLQGCDRPAARPAVPPSRALSTVPAGGRGRFTGFDRNDYPGDARLAELHRSFAFAGYWLTPPPEETVNSWAGKRNAVLQAGFGFLLLANGKLDAQIKHASQTPADLGRADGLAALASAKLEGFPIGAVIFLDQEEGGRLLPEQAAYFFGWTEAVAASAYKPGAYLSGQRDEDGMGPDGKPAFITTAQDVREHVAKDHLHPVALWIYDDTCPPAPGCVLEPPALAASGTMEAIVWQYAQSPRRPELTKSCAATYATDGNCYAGATSDLMLDLNTAASGDPSHGR